MNLENGEVCEQIQDDYTPRFNVFHDLMNWRVKDILLVSSFYDSFILEEDINISERIFSEYSDLRLTSAPRVTRVPSARHALGCIDDDSYDMVIATMHVGDMDIFDLAAEVKKRRPDLPFILLTSNQAEANRGFRDRDTSDIDKIFLWSGNTNILLTIIKYIEDKKNLENDTATGNVRVIIIVEDSIKFYSSFLPLIYTELVSQTQRVVDEGLNDMHRMMRMRARPKIIHTDNYEECLRLFRRYEPYVQCIFSDMRFPRRGKPDPLAGIRLIKKIKGNDPDLPALLMSTEARNERYARELNVNFFDKNSPTLLEDLREFMINDLGFGDFVFHMPDGKEVGRATGLKSLEKILPSIPDESILHHARHNHFSNWLMARAEFDLAFRVRRMRTRSIKGIDGFRQVLQKSISNIRREHRVGVISDFSEESYETGIPLVRIGGGSIGGKARGIAFIEALQASNRLPTSVDGVILKIPDSLIIGTDMFDSFLRENNLLRFAVENHDDQSIAQRFFESSIPDELKHALGRFLEDTQGPLAVRSSSLLEDSAYQPFAGMYSTVMIPNNSTKLKLRLKELCRAIKLVYASSYFQKAKAYQKATGNRVEEEKMAVVIQKIVGRRYGDIYYPHFSGVARSYNFYPVGKQKSEDGIVHVALGLGIIVVDEGVALRFSPKHPKILPQFPTVDDWLKRSQRDFFALEMKGSDPFWGHDTVPYLARHDLDRAEKDGVLNHLGSIYCTDDGVIRDGLGHDGSRLVSFANILKYNTFPLAKIMNTVMEVGQKAMGSPVEIEFSVVLPDDHGEPAELNLLQIRPFIVGKERKDINVKDRDPASLLVQSSKALGHSSFSGIRDIVYVRADRFDNLKTMDIAREVGEINTELARDDTPFLLLGIGRWGTADRFLGIPVSWDQIHGARVIVEAGTEDFNIEPSHGTHFFMNITSFQIGYMSVDPSKEGNFIDWDWLEEQKPLRELKYVRHLRFDDPLEVLIDGYTQQAVVIKPDAK